jgi:hypothetical protein
MPAMGYLKPLRTRTVRAWLPRTAGLCIIPL